ncbi:MAG: hypothetical protein IJU71_13300 [Selenomonadaceae bacterium]|nr:hypothetical protein [Selenomonadaceae bacterium]
MKLDLKCVPLEAILLAKDFCEAEHGFSCRLTYVGSDAEIFFEGADDEQRFSEELNDYIKRLMIAERTRTLKELIIGRALYGNIERC